MGEAFNAMPFETIHPNQHVSFILIDELVYEPVNFDEIEKDFIAKWMEPLRPFSCAD